MASQQVPRDLTIFWGGGVQMQEDEEQETVDKGIPVCILLRQATQKKNKRPKKKKKNPTPPKKKTKQKQKNKNKKAVMSLGVFEVVIYSIYYLHFF